MATWSDYDRKNPPPIPGMEVRPGPVNTHPGPDFAPKEKEPETPHEWQGAGDLAEAESAAALGGWLAEREAEAGS